MDEKYCLLYEDRYRRVYSQGVDYWTADPAEIAETTRLLDEFLAAAGARPGERRVLECGCGEGHLACHLIGLGYDYIGADISPSAVAKARLRVRGTLGRDESERLIVCDATDLSRFHDASFDIVVDNFCLHMLVTDPHRRAYLTGLRRVLCPHGWAYFHENLSAEKFAATVETFAAYVARFHPDMSSLEERAAYQAGEPRRILLPRVPARATDREGYEEELSAAGLEVKGFAVRRTTCIVYARSGVPGAASHLAV